MSDDLTLEKLAIVERLLKVETSVALSVEHSKASSARVEEMFTGIKKILEKHEVEIHGETDKPGLKTHVDRLLQIEDGRKWTIRAMAGTIISLIGKIVYEAVGKK